MTEKKDTATTTKMRWARFRFSIIGPLLAAPPERGRLHAALKELADKAWQHPTTGEMVRFSISSLERWYYQARSASDDPIQALGRKVLKSSGTHPSVTPKVEDALRQLYRQHPTWSHQLHHDNLKAMAKSEASLAPIPSYNTVLRFMKSQGWIRQRRRRRGKSTKASEFVPKEKRSFEVPYVHSLWHLDFHEGRRKIITKAGEWRTPFLLGILDDYSRLACHLQWYWGETAQSLVHGLCQAFQKRGLPRGLLTDNGSAMLAEETTQGLLRLGIVHYTTLPYTPEQNGKQESFWGPVEGRLMAMLEGQPKLSLAELNNATQAWVEMEYNRSYHSELGASPLDRFLEGPTVGRSCPNIDTLRRAFMRQVRRKQRRSDGTVSLEGRRFELPNRYRTIQNPVVRFAKWDLSCVDLVDPKTEQYLCSLSVQDKQKNADRKRRFIQEPDLQPQPEDAGIAPHLKSMMAEYAATGLPPAYLLLDTEKEEE